MNLKDFKSAISQLAEERGISEERVLETIEAAIAAAYKKDYGKKTQKIIAKLDEKTGKPEFWQVKKVVDETMILSDEELEKTKEQGMSDPVQSADDSDLDEEKKVRFNPERHIMIKDAKKIDSKVNLSDEMEISLESKQDYGRIAAQTAKQVILQRIKEAERETILQEYQDKEGEVVSGIVQRVERDSVYFDIGKILGILPKEEQIPGEFYKLGQRFKLYVLKVEKSSKGALVFLSRAFPKFISKLFEVEVPEIPTGQVTIRAIAREAGSRTKIAVSSSEEGIDPIGSVVGQRGTRVMAVINELGGEKIDIIEFSDNTNKFIANSLLPAKVLQVQAQQKNKAVCVVPEDQLSLAIGKNGQNVRLAAKLTGWKIDIQSDTEQEQKKKKEKKQEKEKKKNNKNQEKKSSKDSLKTNTDKKKNKVKKGVKKETIKKAKKKISKTEK